jgi:phosphinothricin acetyltransferase
MKHELRLASVSDSEEILKIYRPYITDTAISFETEVPTVEEFSSRVENITKQYPFLVDVIDGKVAGYAYASKHRERAAYAYDVDVSIYVLPEYHGLEVAYRLYDCLFAILDKLGYKNAYAAYTEPNAKSMRFHQKFGFTLIGTHHKTGYKLKKWHDVTWLEKRINTLDESPNGVLAITEIPLEYFESLFRSYTAL